MKRIAVLGVLTVTLAACVTTPEAEVFLYDGPGPFQHFADAQYQCARETTVVEVEGFVVDGDGFVRSEETRSCSLFVACMASRGYTRVPQGEFDPSSLGIRCQYP